MEYMIFTDDWWYWFVKNYGVTIAIGWAILKGIAILDPSNKTNQVLDTFRGLLPGQKEMARRATDQPPKE